MAKKLMASDRLTDLQSDRLAKWFLVPHFAAKNSVEVEGSRLSYV